jgi:hypothetical protein
MFCAPGPVSGVAGAPERLLVQLKPEAGPLRDGQAAILEDQRLFE